eukprot:CAMPEP_0201593834 /NCGR_PEP_ID=MMETSP0190_2-20130828/191338_1 /ASSEMBLY_ACC=CAM_ASM_000263 /TAXON_ID=37353 /ORGANISM="Rosalina sp." /LENGTH=55 /DNA_ID=CAMNT_0048053215 /DNA_START=1685 /DNA_END=1852 /DNA_ORIENTATION=+
MEKVDFKWREMGIGNEAGFGLDWMEYARDLVGFVGNMEMILMELEQEDFKRGGVV